MSVHIGDATYMGIWRWLFNTLLLGFWGKVVAVICLGLFFWFGLRTKNIGAALVWLLFAALFAYGGSFLRIFGLKG